MSAPYNPLADIIARLIADSAEPQDHDYSDRCPECGEPGINLNVGRDHWFICFEDMVRWHVGSNLISVWQDESLAEWERNRTILKRFRQVNRKSETSGNSDYARSYVLSTSRTGNQSRCRMHNEKQSYNEPELIVHGDVDQIIEQTSFEDSDVPPGIPSRPFPIASV